MQEVQRCRFNTWVPVPSFFFFLIHFYFFFFFILFSFILFFFYQLEASYFTILQWVLSYIDMNQPWIDLYAFPVLIPPPTTHSTRSLQVFPVHQVRALFSCIQPGLVICSTLDNIHVSMLFSGNIPPSPSPTPLFLTGKFHGQRRLVGCRSGGRRHN